MGRLLLLSSLLTLLAFPVLARDLDAELVLAATAGRPQEITQLIHEGAHPGAVNSEGTPALALASLRTDYYSKQALQALMDSGADIDVKDKLGQSPLFYAARAGNAESVTFLLQHGATPYLTDNSGNIARTIAYNAGQKAMVVLMDDFITSQTKQRMDQYADRNRQIAERSAQLRDAAKPKPQLAAGESSGGQPPVIPNPPPRKPPPPPVDTAHLKALVRELSLHACAAQYWSYLKRMNQDVPFSTQGLNDLIEAHERLNQTAAEAMSREFHAPKNYIMQIDTPSRQQIVRQISPFPTNAHRKEEGIGTKEDENQRCSAIADQWTLGRR